MTKIYKLISKLGFAVFAMTASLVAQAAIVTADFREELSLPFCCGSGVRVFENLAKPVAGVDLTAANQIANPSGYSGHADMDLSSTGLLTLIGREPSGFANYEVATFLISGITFNAGEFITGVTVLDGTGIFDGSFGGFPLPTTSFTADSFTISYSTPNQFNFGEGQTARFQLVMTSQSDVPEPGSLALLGFGLAGLIAMRRKQKAS